MNDSTHEDIRQLYMSDLSKVMDHGVAFVLRTECVKAMYTLETGGTVEPTVMDRIRQAKAMIDQPPPPKPPKPSAAESITRCRTLIADAESEFSQGLVTAGDVARRRRRMLEKIAALS